MMTPDSAPAAAAGRSGAQIAPNLQPQITRGKRRMHHNSTDAAKRDGDYE
jgi:hypothetical protein